MYDRFVHERTRTSTTALMRAPQLRRTVNQQARAQAGFPVEKWKIKVSLVELKSTENAKSHQIRMLLEQKV